jgi:Flp pilus assembly protein TadD
MNPVPGNKKLQEARTFLANYNFPQALLLFEKLVREFSHKPEMWMEYASANLRAGEFERADQAWQRVLEMQPATPDLFMHIGHLCKDFRQGERAQKWFEKAAAVDPQGINPRMALAILFEQSNRFSEAHDAIGSCLAIDPKDEQARYYEAFLDRRENKLEDAERRLRDLIASNPRHQYVQYASRYELAEVLNRTERFDEAMQTLFEAKNIVRRYGPNVEAMLVNYQKEADSDRRAAQQAPKDILRAWAKKFPAKDREPKIPMAFLGGHPRSGTTLLEQILGAHPSVAALDEPFVFLTVVWKMFKESSDYSSARLNVIRKRYFDGIRKEADVSLDGKLVLDKNPSPTAKLPVWLRMFPDLKVLVALRDPRDIVISCFFQNITLSQANVNFLSLERTAKHYADLMDVWLAVRQWEGLNAVETRYEDVVADLEKEGRRVTEFLGLTWDGSQKAFYEKSSKKKMHAPTYRDASQPVYTRAVARWHAYEKHLAPILPVLEPYCKALGYA